VAVDCTPRRPRRAEARREGSPVGDAAPARVRTARVPVTPAGSLRASAGRSEPSIGSPTCPCPDSPCSARRPGSAVGRAGTLRGGEPQAPAPPGAAPHRYALRHSALLSPPSAPTPSPPRTPRGLRRLLHERQADAPQTSLTRCANVPDPLGARRPCSREPRGHHAGPEHRSTRAVETAARATAPRRRDTHVTRSTTSVTNAERRPAAPRPSPPP
jgi:hypothetical protein